MNNIERIQLNYIVRAVENNVTRPWLDVIREEVDKIKSCKESDQTVPSNINNKFEDIIPLEADIDNGEIYDIESGQTIKDLI